MSGKGVRVLRAVARRALGVAFVGGLAVLLSTAPVSAHSVLVSSSPPDGSIITSAPKQVTLTFNENIIAVGDEVSVLSPTGANVAVGTPSVVNATVTQPIKTLDTNGRYSISYRIVSADGHPVYRTLTFTLNVAGLPTATATASAQPTSAPASTGSSGHLLLWILVGAGIVGIVIGLTASLASRGGKRSNVEDDAVATDVQGRGPDSTKGPSSEEPS